MPRSRQKQRQETRKDNSGPRLAQIEPKSPNQKKYFQSIRNNTYTFVVGPPGTGKTFIAMYHALLYLLDRRVDKIVVIRPLVEVTNFDEKGLGALPGDAKEKMTPWMGGMMDSLKEIIPEHDFKRLLANGTIEVFNMALCRGRSFNRTFVIVDEAQNITIEGDAMKMLLTRLGRESKMVIAGDLKQADIGTKKGSALKDAIKKFWGESGFGVCLLEPADIVRNPLISRILEIYGEYDEKGSISLEDILQEKK